MQDTLENVWKAAEKLTREEQLELAEKLIRKLREKERTQQLDWQELYGLGKGLWKEDAQDYVNRLREDRG